MRKHPVIWISGPPGCGKTTLASSYIEARKLPCLWYQVDEGDSDPATFFYYLGQAAKMASPRKKKALPLLTPEYLQDVATFTYRYFEGLSDRLKNPSLLVFDNYQEVPAQSPFHGIILNGLSRIPERVNVMLISRGEPSPAFIRLRANNLMGNLEWEKLRLNRVESRSIVRLKTRQRLSPKTIQHLHTLLQIHGSK
jgi:ATP/maltotriose-dependent transcriptional regulator MalT